MRIIIILMLLLPLSLLAAEPVDGRREAEEFINGIGITKDGLKDAAIARESNLKTQMPYFGDEAIRQINELFDGELVYEELVSMTAKAIGAEDLRRLSQAYGTERYSEEMKRVAPKIMKFHTEIGRFMQEMNVKFMEIVRVERSRKAKINDLAN